MSAVTELETKLAHLKNTAEGDLHGIAVKLEAIYQHIVGSHVETVVKDAVVADVHDAATKVQTIADTMRSDVDAADDVVDAVAKK